MHHIIASTKFCVLPTEKCLYFKQCNSVRESFCLLYNNLLFSSVCEQSLKNRQKSAQSQSDWLCAPYFLNYLESEMFFRERPFIKNVSFGGAQNVIYSKLVNNPLKLAYIFSHLFSDNVIKGWGSVHEILHIVFYYLTIQ